jgi:galactonate dehydratase
MHVTDYELYEVAPRWQFLKLETGEGLVGWGEVYAKWHYAGADTVTASGAAVDQMMEKYVLGEDPTEIERLWERMYRSSFYRGGAVHMSAVAGIDEALWDLKGKRHGLPVYELLGGRARDRVRLYHHASAEDAAQAVEDGFDAIKMGPSGTLDHVEKPERVQAFVDRVAEARAVVGDGVDIGIDFHGRVSKPTVARLAENLEPYEPMFIEEPVTPEFAEVFPEIAASTSIPIATGERLHTRFQFKRYLENGGLDVVQPDVSHAGGITESKKIADMASSYDAALAPHCPIGPVALMSSIHVMATASNALIQEQILSRTDGWERYVEDPAPLEHENGFVELPTDPGLGIEVDEDVVRELDGQDLDYSRPVYEYADGGVGDG